MIQASRGTRVFEDVDEALGYFGVDALDSIIVMRVQRCEPHHKIWFGGIDAVGFDNLRIGCKMIRMQKIKDHFQKFHLRGDLRGYRSICPIRVRTISR